jgi:hypothetical protein
VTKAEIERRLRVLRNYELGLHRNSWDSHDRVSDELVKVLTTKLKLQAMLKSATEGK